MLAWACGGTPPAATLPPPPTPEANIEGASLGPSDVFEVRVYQEKELSGSYRVGSDGKFTFPLVGPVSAEGCSPAELADILTERLRRGFLRNPQVSVFIQEFNSKKVFVLGEVNKPGTFRFEDNMSIVQAITLAGGFKALADKNRIVLTRLVDGQELKYVVPVEAIGQGRGQNLLLQPGDIVFVPESWL